MRRRVSVFGATGSIGCNTIDLLNRQGGREAYDVVALTGAANVELLAQQARRLDAEFAVTADATRLADLTALLEGCRTRAMAGPEALVTAAAEDVDWAMSAIVGAAGLAPTLALARSARILALANKESLVCAGALLQEECARHGTMLMPVDSEHSAIFQALQGEDHGAIERILITASGGPFRTWSKAAIDAATPAQALKHPNWSMGARITIDSASLFNKALEVIEAHQLFAVDPDQIEVVIHPQSIVHSMIGFADGAVMAQLGAPDMRGPIGYALNYPDRAALPVERLDFAKLSQLDFEAPDAARFPALTLARQVMRLGGASGAVLNAAKEVALDAFLEHRIGFSQMAETVAYVLDDLGPKAAQVTVGDGLQPIMDLDRHARAAARTYIVTTSVKERQAV